MSKNVRIVYTKHTTRDDAFRAAQERANKTKKVHYIHKSRLDNAWIATQACPAPTSLHLERVTPGVKPLLPGQPVTIHPLNVVSLAAGGKLPLPIEDGRVRIRFGELQYVDVCINDKLEIELLASGAGSFTQLVVRHQSANSMTVGLIRPDQQISLRTDIPSIP